MSALTNVVGLHGPGFPGTLVSGACPTGADRMCEAEAMRRGWTVERHEPKWHIYGKAAGAKRNQKMVKLGADVCVAFIHNGSKRASHAVRCARKAGITVVIYREDRE